VPPQVFGRFRLVPLKLHGGSLTVRKVVGISILRGGARYYHRVHDHPPARRCWHVLRGDA
jgi:hypothetical protein